MIVLWCGAVPGKYRTGKSFLLNCLLGRQSGFVVGPTIEACTKGIWIWGNKLVLSRDSYAEISRGMSVLVVSGRPLEVELSDGQRCKVCCALLAIFKC